MTTLKEAVDDFLAQKRIAVAGVSREPNQAANLVYRALRKTNYQVFAVNPSADQAEGDPCYPDLKSIPGGVDAVVIATPPGAAEAIVRDCAEQGISRVWMHRSFGKGSVSEGRRRPGPRTRHRRHRRRLPPDVPARNRLRTQVYAPGPERDRPLAQTGVSRSPAGDSPGGTSMVKLVAVIRKRDENRPDEFLRYWREVHAPIVAKVPGLRRYVISPAIGTGTGPEYDGIAELWFDDAEALGRAMASPEWRAVSVDTPIFVDAESIIIFPTQEETIV